MVTSQMLVDLFSKPLSNLEGLEGEGPPVVEAKVDHGGKFSFVLFRNNQLATIALSLFNKMEFYGRPLLCDRPQVLTHVLTPGVVALNGRVRARRGRVLRILLNGCGSAKKYATFEELTAPDVWRDTSAASE